MPPSLGKAIDRMPFFSLAIGDTPGCGKPTLFKKGTTMLLPQQAMSAGFLPVFLAEGTRVNGPRRNNALWEAIRRRLGA